MCCVTGLAQWQLGACVQDFSDGSLCVQEVTAINLSNAHGSEGKLGQAYMAENDRFGQAGRGLRLFAFDFHAICGSTRYERCVCMYMLCMQMSACPARQLCTCSL